MTERAKVWYVNAYVHSMAGFEKEDKLYVGGDGGSREDLFVASSFENAWNWLVANKDEFGKKVLSHTDYDGDYSGLYAGWYFYINSIYLDSENESGKDWHVYDSDLNELDSDEEIDCMSDEEYCRFLKFQPYRRVY